MRMLSGVGTRGNEMRGRRRRCGEVRGGFGEGSGTLGGTGKE